MMYTPAGYNLGVKCPIIANIVRAPTYIRAAFEWFYVKCDRSLHIIGAVMNFEHYFS